jgi:hypothetical protein
MTDVSDITYIADVYGIGKIGTGHIDSILVYFAGIIHTVNTKALECELATAYAVKER